MQKLNDKDAPKTTCCAVPSFIKKYLHYLPSDPNVRKEWMYFILNEVPDGVSKNLVLYSLNFTMDLFTKNTQFYTVFAERLKLIDDAVPTILDLTVISHHTCVSNCFYYVVPIALSVKQIV